MGKMDPCQMDKWWKTRIQKEETTYANNAKQSNADSTTVRLNSLGTAQEVPKAPAAAESHLVGSGALVRQAKSVALADVGTAGGSKAGSVASLKLKVDLETGSQAGSQAARSNVSYPKTPQFSQVGSKAGSSAEIMNRLARLEKDLVAERERRVAVESEMKELVSKAHSVAG